MRQLIPRIKAAICYAVCQNHQCVDNPECPFVKETGKTSPKSLKDWAILSKVCAECEVPCDSGCEPLN